MNFQLHLLSCCVTNYNFVSPKKNNYFTFYDTKCYLLSLSSTKLPLLSIFVMFYFLLYRKIHKFSLSATKNFSLFAKTNYIYFHFQRPKILSLSVTDTKKFLNVSSFICQKKWAVTFQSKLTFTFCHQKYFHFLSPGMSLAYSPSLQAVLSKHSWFEQYLRAHGIAMVMIIFEETLTSGQKWDCIKVEVK